MESLLLGVVLEARRCNCKMTFCWRADCSLGTDYLRVSYLESGWLLERSLGNMAAVLEVVLVSDVVVVAF
jgi:hypothetical protein